MNFQWASNLNCNTINLSLIFASIPNLYLVVLPFASLSFYHFRDLLFAVEQIGLQLITSSPKIFQLVSLQQTFFIEIVTNFNLHETSQQDHNIFQSACKLQAVLMYNFSRSDLKLLHYFKRYLTGLTQLYTNVWSKFQGLVVWTKTN